MNTETLPIRHKDVDYSVSIYKNEAFSSNRGYFSKSKAYKGEYLMTIVDVNKTKCVKGYLFDSDTELFDTTHTPYHEIFNALKIGGRI